MIIKSRNQWIALYGISFRRFKLSINPDNFTRFWQIASSIFPNLSLICSNKEVFLILTLKSKELGFLKKKLKKFLIKLNNLLHTSSLSDLELKFHEMEMENYNFLFDLSNLNEISNLDNKLSSNNKFTNDINQVIIGDTEVLKIKKVASNKIIYQSNNLYKLTIRFDDINLNNNFITTFNAILAIARNIIIGSSNYGKTKSILVNLSGVELEVVDQLYDELLQIMTNSNQITGNMRIIKFNEIKKDSLFYSLGLIHSNESNLTSLTRFVNYIPQILKIS